MVIRLLPVLKTVDLTQMTIHRRSRVKGIPLLPPRFEGKLNSYLVTISRNCFIAGELGIGYRTEAGPAVRRNITKPDTLD